MKNVGYARKRDDNEPGIIAALELAGASVVTQDKPTDLLVGYNGDTDLLEVKNGNQPPSWQRVTKDQAEFFRTWQGKRAQIVRSMMEALEVIDVPHERALEILAELSKEYDAAGVPLAAKK